MSIKGLDVSEFQGTVDWEQVKAAGYQFVMLRAGYGSGIVDKQFHRNASECSRLGIPIGAYWFCYASSPQAALREADACINTISGYQLDYPVCYDIEQASAAYAAGEGVTMTSSLTRQLVQNFCNRLEEKGWYAMFYTNRNFFDTCLDPALTKRYAFWYAWYAGSPDRTNCGIWQYTNEGSVPGVSGNVNLNQAYIDYPAVIRAAGLNHLSDSVPAPHPVPCPSPNYITYVLQPGDTLNRIARRYGTTVSVLASLNDITDPDLIYTGNTLRIPENESSDSFIR